MEYHLCAGPAGVPVELADRLGWLLARAGQLVGAAVQEALAEHGLSPRELSVLAAAAAPQARPQLGLAIAVGVDKTTMVATVDALEARGLVRRETAPHDRRLRLVAVTDEGRAAAERAGAAAAAAEREVLAVLPEPDRERLVDLLRALVAGSAHRPLPGSCF